MIQPRETGSGQVTGRKRDPIIRSGLRRADRGRGYHKSRLTVGKIFAARATGREFRFFTLFEYTKACMCTVASIVVKALSLLFLVENINELSP